jgi:hypothetical protein
MTSSRRRRFVGGVARRKSTRSARGRRRGDGAMGSARGRDGVATASRDRPKHPWSARVCRARDDDVDDDDDEVRETKMLANRRK